MNEKELIEFILSHINFTDETFLDFGVWKAKITPTKNKFKKYKVIQW